jgi:hypothetical protein
MHVARITEELFSKLNTLRDRTTDLANTLEQPQKVSDQYFARLHSSILERKQFLIETIELHFADLEKELNAYKSEFEENARLQINENAAFKKEIFEFLSDVRHFYEFFFGEIDCIDQESVSDDVIGKLTDGIVRADNMLDEIKDEESRVSSIIYNNKSLEFREKPHNITDNLIGSISVMKVNIESEPIIENNSKYDNLPNPGRYSFEYVQKKDFSAWLESPTSTLKNACITQIDQNKYLLSYTTAMNKLMLLVLDSDFNMIARKEDFFHNQSIFFYQLKFSCNKLFVYLAVSSDTYTYLNSQKLPTKSPRFLLMLNKDTLEIEHELNSSLGMYDDMVANEHNVFVKARPQNMVLILNLKLEIVRRLSINGPESLSLTSGFLKMFASQNELLLVFEDKSKCQFVKKVDLSNGESSMIEFYSYDKGVCGLKKFHQIESKHLISLNRIKRQMQVYRLEDGAVFLDNQLDLPKEINQNSLVFDTDIGEFNNMLVLENTFLYQIKCLFVQ